MSRLKVALDQAEKRKNRVRAKVGGTTDCPRLSINVSNRNITAQIIDDEKQKTLVYVTSVRSKGEAKETMTEKAVKIGTEVAKKAKTAKINKVVFDRGNRLYHGRIKALAEAAREGGLEF
jgi:large subunit ribosomal protein L18